MTSVTVMTFEEATRIRRQAERGALDLRLPGTAEVVSEADRVCAAAAVWGDTPADRRRSMWGVAGISAAVLAIVAACMLPLPF
ncbi:hypothetical protein [Leifsonia sp. NPDC080035]|uniref:Uncharacterized protein n=1 Tax=Leifsonia sp. NPDC080035 TaxID=3143936 RepID=A0AAU7GEQ7_9MICO